MEPTPEMYTTLFNGVTDVRTKLLDIVTELDKLQEKAEDIYINEE